MRKQWISGIRSVDGKPASQPLPAPHEIYPLPDPSKVDERGNPVLEVFCENRFKVGGVLQRCRRPAHYSVRAAEMEPDEETVRTYEDWPQKLCQACAGFYRESRRAWDWAHRVPEPMPAGGSFLR